MPGHHLHIYQSYPTSSTFLLWSPTPSLVQTLLAFTWLLYWPSKKNPPSTMTSFCSPLHCSESKVLTMEIRSCSFQLSTLSLSLFAFDHRHSIHRSLLCPTLPNLPHHAFSSHLSMVSTSLAFFEFFKHATFLTASEFLCSLWSEWFSLHPPHFHFMTFMIQPFFASQPLPDFF